MVLAKRLQTLGLGSSNPYYLQPQHDMSWWHWVGNLESGTRSFHYQFTVLRKGEKYLAYSALTDKRTGRFFFQEKMGHTTFGDGAKENQLLIKIGDWTVAGNSLLSGLFSLRVHPLKQVVVHQPWDNNSGHFSVTRLETAGRVFLDGKSLFIEGESWFDRELNVGEFLKHQVGWDWFGIQLDDNSELMLCTARGNDDRQVRGTLISAHGKVQYLDPDNIRIRVLEWGEVYPSKWEVRLFNQDRILITACFPSQEITGKFRYWEGIADVTGLYERRPISGISYVELVGYREPFRLDAKEE